MNQKLNPLALVSLFSFVFILLFGTQMMYTVGPGEKAVVFYRFGKGLDKDNVKGQGFHLIAPWNTKYIYNVRIQEDLSLMEVLSKNGLTIKTELSYRYKPVDSKIGYVGRNIAFLYLMLNINKLFYVSTSPGRDSAWDFKLNIYHVIF